MLTERRIVIDSLPGWADNGHMTNQEQPKQYFAVGHNMPGYLPESEPWIYTTFGDAKTDLIGTMNNDADFLDDVARGPHSGLDAETKERYHTEAEELSAACEDLNLSNGPEWGTTIGNTSYWIVLTDEAPEDDES